MGGNESKLAFKKGILNLSEKMAIPLNDPYWASVGQGRESSCRDNRADLLQFWEHPESAEDVFSLFSTTDIRRTRDAALPNLETLLRALTDRLFLLRHHPSFPDAEIAPERHVLNCVRVLTRVLPFVYEAEQLREWEERFFWQRRKQRSR